MGRITLFFAVCVGLSILQTKCLCHGVWSQEAKTVSHADLSNYLDDSGRLQPVRSPQDWAKRRAQILAGMQQAMGPLPDWEKRAALDVRITKEEAGEGYTRLSLSYVPEPGDRVPAHLYLPAGKKPGQRLPAILALHPTSPLGKGVVAGEGPKPNRAYALELAQRGYVVLAPDYPSFGDYKYDFDSDRYASGTMKGIWNHMRGVDLLIEREDVDPSRIGVIGHSLGGHNAMFVAAFDRRLAVIVSSCGWTPFHDYYEGKIAGWTSDRYMPRLRTEYQLDPDRVPFDFYEVAAALAPRAFFSNSPLQDDNFAVAGVKKAVPAVQSVYKLLGAERQLVVEYPDSGHDFPPRVREDAYRFIDRALEHKPAKTLDVPSR